MHPRVIIFVGNFFFSMFTSLIIYILLPFLSSFMPEAYTGLVVALGGLVAVIGFPFLPGLVARYGAQELALLFGIAEMIALFALAAAPGAIAGSFLIIIAVALQPFISYELDLLLEATTTEKETAGRVRTIFLTAWNFGALAAPLLLGALLVNSNDYSKIFIAAAALLTPFVVLFAARSLPKGVTPKISHMQDTLVCMAHNRDLAAVTFAHFLLYLFYIWAPLYVPIYLHDVLSIPWSELGWMFSIMLIPYALLEYPAGWLADKYLGDKKLMYVGFIFAGLALASFSVLSASSSLLLILVILICSRIGAALIESMTEGHFFRRVSAQDINSMSIFRGIWPLANIVGPIVGSFILFFGNFQILFAVTGAFILITGIAATSLIQDN
ncbi:MAG: MFS transporter [Candidatus Kaiserbacteria bacterium]|nr:MFS transporter [Candidatus Kaiserbacteria bacterium]